MTWNNAIVHFHFEKPNGDPAAGSVTFTPNSALILDTTGHVTWAGAQSFPLDEAGEVVVSIPPTDTTALAPSNRQWKVSVRLTHTNRIPTLRGQQFASGQTYYYDLLVDSVEAAPVFDTWLTETQYLALVGRVAALEASGGGGGAVASVNAKTGVVVLAKGDVGLSNVDNTADAAKPVSTAQATADTAIGTAAATDATTKANAAQAAAIQRANHTGTQSADTLTDGTTNKAFLATERTKLTGIATSATANSTDAALRDRSTHTGTQAESTVTNLVSDLAAKMVLQQVATTVTVDGAAVVNKHNPVDATAANRAITLPTGQAEGTQISVEKVDSSTNTVSITGNIRGVAATTIALAYLSESLMLRADSAGSWWPVAGHRTKTSLDATYAARTAVVTGSATAFDVTQNNGTDLLSYATHVSDNAANAGILHKLHHYGTGYGLDIQNFPGASSGIVLHQYSALVAGMQLDNCGNQPVILMRNTQNQTLAPGTVGTGAFFDFQTDAGTAGSPNLLRYGQLDKDINLVAYQTGKPWTFHPALGIAVEALKVSQAETNTGLLVVKSGTDASSATAALWVQNSTAQAGVKIDQSGGNSALKVSTTAGAAGSWPVTVDGQNYGPKFTTTTDGGESFTIAKNGTGAGRALLLTNKGTGNSIEVADATSSRLIIDKSGQITKLNNATVTQTAGSGSPEGVVTAPIGSTYQRTDGGAATSFYVKESGAAASGWVGK